MIHKDDLKASILKWARNDEESDSELSQNKKIELTMSDKKEYDPEAAGSYFELIVNVENLGVEFLTKVVEFSESVINQYLQFPYQIPKEAKNKIATALKIDVEIFNKTEFTKSDYNDLVKLVNNHASRSSKRKKNFKNFKYEIVEHVTILSEKNNGWKKELNKVSWNDKPAKYDLRDWHHEDGKMGKGVTLTDEEVVLLTDALIKLK